jgi:ketosteroid isomerase-like protein
MIPVDLETAIAEYHQACVDVVAGKPEPLVQVYSRHDDVTLSNPWGPPVRGWAQIAKAVTAAASHFREGRGTVERISETATPQLAYVVEIERYETKIDGAEQLGPLAVRVTSVFRLEENRWRVIHRHADRVDPTTSAPPLGLAALFR